MPGRRARAAAPIRSSRGIDVSISVDTGHLLSEKDVPAFGIPIPLLTMSRSHYSHILITCALLPLACSSEQGEEASPAIEEALRDELEALGYAEWTEGDDAGDLQLAGVTRHDAEQVVAGINLFELRGLPRVQLMDMDGAILHQWVAPRGDDHTTKKMKTKDVRGWHGFKVFPNGDLVGLHRGHCIERLDWDSNLRWRTHLRVHHDLDIDSEGRIYTLTNRRMTLEVHDGTPISIIDDEIAILDANDGRMLERVSLAPFFASSIPGERIAAIRRFEERDPSTPTTKEQRVLETNTRDVFHTNTIEIIRRDLPGVAKAGDIMLSVRELDLVAILDLEQRRIVWSWGPGEVLRQHHPTVLPNGNILIFDNRLGEKYSRIIELEPLRKTIVWEYRGDPPSSFNSGYRGSSFRMPNGNVLVAESNKGRAFEVTRGGEIVWEYLSSEVSAKKRKRATFYRFNRLPIDYFESHLLAAFPQSSVQRYESPGL